MSPSSLLQRQIVREIVVVSFFALIGVSGLLMIVGALVEARKTGLDPLQLLRLLPLLVAPTLPYTIPACLLFGCTYVFGGMSGSNEIVALKASGVNVMQVVRPVFLLGVLVSVLNLHLVDTVIPSAERTLRNAITGDIESMLFAYLRQKGCINEANIPYELYVKSVDGDRLIQPIIKHRRSTGEGYDMVLQAREATLKVVPGANVWDTEVVLRLIDGALSTGNEGAAYFRDRTERLPLPGGMTEEGRSVANKTFAGLDKMAEKNREEIRELETALSIDLMALALKGEPLQLVHENVEKGFKLTWVRDYAHRSVSEKHQRIARSASAVPFLMLGCPLSILYRRREVLRNFFVCFLPIITLYYPSMLLAFNLVKTLQSEWFAVMWLPTIAMCLAAAPFIRRMVRY